MTQTNETVHKLEKPTHHFSYLTAADGSFLSLDEAGNCRTVTYADDSVIWDKVAAGFKHAASGKMADIKGNTEGTCEIELGGETRQFQVEHGPEKLPSEYLEHFFEHGWVCLTCVLPDEVVEGLEQIAGTDRHADLKFNRKIPTLSQNPAVARTAAEPLSLWLMRQYMGTNEVRLGHPPSLAILNKDDGERNVQGWHSDFPYLWGFDSYGGDERFGRVPTPSGQTVLGIQRNVCISDFSRERGATAFKLGSSKHDQGPPVEWGLGGRHHRPGYRAKHGLPYHGPDADILEAPGGSIILYDSRTWHRQGVNQTDNVRSAMLQAMVPGYVMPFFDTSQPYKHFLKSEAYTQVNERERQEIANLMIHHIVGPMGKHAITIDEELSEHLND
ncbi:MAG: phytanoyl-CoA dioxygenase family protein [Pseudomonadota bacterium]